MNLCSSVLASSLAADLVFSTIISSIFSFSDLLKVYEINVSKTAKVKNPAQGGYKLVWIFDHSSCHRDMADDAFNAEKMNVNPGGKQPVMHDIIWAGRLHKTTFTHGIPKGMRKILGASY